MEERDWATSTTGYGIDVFTDAGQEYIMDIVLDDLSNAEYYDAFRSFVNLCDEFITEAENGRPYDVGHMPKGKYPAAMIIISSLGIGFIVAGINNLINRGQLKSVRANNSAVDYVVPGSLDLTEERELFLYHQVSAVKKSSESSSGGGSSTHRSSSGTSHGGSSGKF